MDFIMGKICERPDKKSNLDLRPLEFKLWLVQATATGGKLKLELQFANFEP